jgi:Domain of unknown function (DUF4129)
VRSRSPHSHLMPIVALLLAAPAAAPCAPGPGPERLAEIPGPEQIARALERVKADPNLATERTIKTLKWKEPTRQHTPKYPWWLAWIVGLFGWVGASARYLIWVSAVVLAGILGLHIVRLFRGAELARRGGQTLVIPTHVRDLDIRPESLPVDIGAAARAYWDDGRRREALGLLYRGLLSRLAHVHSVPIRDSTTEGECLALAAVRLTPRRQEYAGRLVLLWQRAVYGSEQIESAAVYALCREFPVLDLSSPVSPAPRHAS